ncbi:MAG: FtsW/RodA/SpoVE family cell cycle protein [Gemmatimonadota bacterium]
MIRLFERWALDSQLVLWIVGLTLFGLAMIYSAGQVNVPNVVTEFAWFRQARWFVIALVAFTVLSRIPLRWIEWAAVPSYVVSVVLLALTLVIGEGRGTAQGVRSFINLGFFSFQPEEVAKLSTVLALAHLLSQKEAGLHSLRELIAPGMLVAVPLVLVLGQPDLGTAMAFVGILFAMLYWAATPVWLLLLVASPVVGLFVSYNTVLWSMFIVTVVGFLVLLRYRLSLFESVAVVLTNFATATIARPLWDSLAEYQQNRILVYLDPEVDPRGAGYQVIQSKLAIGSGAFEGRGFTLGPQKRFDFLPEQHTDFIFAVVGEEFGFIGTTLAVVAFTFVLARLVRMASHMSESQAFAGLVLLGIFGLWLVHVFVNIGMTIGIVPITGIPLPFLSYGGTFLLMSWVAVAIAVRVAHEEP